MIPEKRTRGFGLLEKFLSSKRARQADNLIPDSIRNGSLLDIGCGAYPFFLTHTKFRNKFGIDQGNDLSSLKLDGIELQQWDVSNNETLPFSSNSFEAVTMLAVLEHIEPSRIICILNEIHRIMKPGGCLIMTSPSSWTTGILFILSRFSIISRIEIDDHKHAYSLSELSALIGKSNFSGSSTTMGHFEWKMNMWAKVTKV